MNYFEHGSYLTVNHAHAAFMGVYGNISIAALLFATRLLVKPEYWNAKLINISFWSINVGLMLMVVLDLFPAGALQFKATLDHGLWFSRSEAFIGHGIFKSLTWLRGIGASIFLFGGVIPITWFMLTRIPHLKDVITKYISLDEDIHKEDI